MDDVARKQLTDSFFEVAGFMVVSARGLMDEPASYGPFRLIDAASRLIAFLEQQDLSTEALTRLRDAIEEGKTSCMATPEEFRDFLDTLAISLVAGE